MTEESDGTSEIEQKLAALRGVIGKSDFYSPSNRQEKFYRYILTLIRNFGMKQDNPFVDLLGHAGNYWRSGMLLFLRDGPRRPAQISKIFLILNASRPLSQRILNLNLKMLERDGLLERNIVNDNSKHVEYKLTALGHIISDHIWSLMQSIGDHGEEVMAAKMRFDTAKRTPNSDLDDVKFLSQ